MTTIDLDQMPEFERYSYVEFVKNGQKCIQPIANEMLGWSMCDEDDPLYAVDQRGQAWTFLKLHGQLHKVKSSLW